MGCDALNTDRRPSPEAIEEERRRTTVDTARAIGGGTIVVLARDDREHKIDTTVRPTGIGTVNVFTVGPDGKPYATRLGREPGDPVKLGEEKNKDNSKG